MFCLKQILCWFHVVIIEALAQLHTSDFVINQGNRQKNFKALLI